MSARATPSRVSAVAHPSWDRTEHTKCSPADATTFVSDRIIEFNLLAATALARRAPPADLEAVGSRRGACARLALRRNPLGLREKLFPNCSPSTTASFAGERHILAYLQGKP